MKKRVSVLISILFCVVGFLFFLIPQKAQIIRLDPSGSGTDQKDGDLTAQGNGLFLYVVNTTSDTVVPGACQNGNPDCSLRGAILEANTNSNADTINFAIPASDSGCSAGVCTINIPSVLPNISTSMEITGPGSGKLILKSTGANVQVLSVTTAVTVTLSGLTISNGTNAGSGGGIYNPAGTVNVNGCTISGNQAIHGGTGAGIYSAGTLNVTNSTISGNHTTTGNGGGIVNAAGTTNVTNSTISGNSGNANGGGIYNFGGGTVNVTNSTISGNTANLNNGRGGGILNAGGTVTVKNSIIALNLSTLEGPDVNGIFVSAGFNLIGKTDGSTGFTAATDQTGTVASPLNPNLDSSGLKYNGGPTQTIALLAGSPAIDKGTSVGLTGDLTTDQRGAGFPRTFDNPAVPNAAGGNGTDIGAFERQQIRPFDFDGDGKTDIGIFRPGPAEWWYLRSSDNQVRAALQFGATADRIVPGDFTGDGKADVAVWRPSNGFWYVLRSEDNSFFAFPFGTNSDVPVPADYDADGKVDAAVFRPSTNIWYILQSGGGTAIMRFGAAGDQPVVADYDGDGKADIGIFRPSAGEWWILRSTAGLLALQFGNGSDKPVQGDYTGDSKADVAFWRPADGFWYVLRSEDFSFFAVPFGTNGDIPAPGDYDGDGKFDTTVFRPSQATWYIQRSTAGTLITQFGANGDRPIPNAFVP